MESYECIKMEKEEFLDRVRHSFDASPVGVLIFNEKLEMVYFNDSVLGYFEKDVDLSKKLFGNVFHCENVYATEKECGTDQRCFRCKIRNSLLEAFQRSRSIYDIHVNKKYIVKNEVKSKWFNINMVPLEYNGLRYIKLEMQDVSEEIIKKIEEEISCIVKDLCENG